MTAPVPAGPTDAQGELREEIARAVSLAWNPDQTWLWDDDVWEQYRKAADAVLALPTMRDALAAQETVERVRDVVDKAGPMLPRASVRRALDGNW